MYEEEFQRLKAEFQSLRVSDEANLKRLTNELENVLGAVLPKDTERYMPKIKKAFENHFPQMFIDDTDMTPMTWPHGRAEMVAVIESIEHQVRLKSAQEQGASEKQATISNRVFVVHGRNAAMKDAIVAYVQRLGIEAIVLMDEPSRNQTVIEKIESYSDVSFAIVIFSADDVGRLAVEEAGTERLRARQNAVLELGYFMGRLGRHNACVVADAAVDGEMEYPSDMAGIVRIPYREGGDWQTKLVRELRASEVKFDATRA